MSETKAAAAAAAAAATAATVLEPGLVHIPGLLTPEEQVDLANLMIRYGNDPEFGFWETDGNGKKKLNSSVTRGRIYEAIDKFDLETSKLLRSLGLRAQTIACNNDPGMPSPYRDNGGGDGGGGGGETSSSTHALMLYYANNRGMGEHRDDGRNDGSGDQPVISFNLGKTIDFSVRHNKDDEKRVIRLESGDALLFGGPSRMILHAVKKIYGGTNPLVEHGIPDVRLNLTLRYAPEILGREEEFKYFKAAEYSRWKNKKEKGEDVAGDMKKRNSPKNSDLEPNLVQTKQLA